MKWLLFISAALLSAAPIKKAAPTDDLEGEPDLFKRYDQIFSIHAEFLYWSAVEGGLDYALKGRGPTWGPTPSFAQGDFERASYGLDPGFRVGALFFRAPHYWELQCQYTRMTNRGKNQSSSPLVATWPQIFTDPLVEARSSLHLNYNLIDWLVTRVFFPNPHLRLRFVGGTLVSWMDQNWRITYTSAHTTAIRNTWSFVGAGLKMGTAIDWYWTGDLYFTGQGFCGILMGSYSNHSKQTTTFQPLSADNPAIPVRDARYQDIRPAVLAQMSLGPSYQKNFSCSRAELFAGFEMNVWSNVQEIYRSTAAAPFQAKETWINASLLAFYGLTTRLTIDF